MTGRVIEVSGSADGVPVTGELAPVLKVLAPSTPMARMIRERLAARSETVDPVESGGEPAPTS